MATNLAERPRPGHRASAAMSLTDLHARLSQVYESIQSFGVPPPQLPVIDASLSQQSDTKPALPGLRHLREEVKRDYDVLDKYLREHANPSTLSTNAPYLIAVWNELIHAHQPIAIYHMFSVPSAQGDAKSSPRGKKAPKIQARTVKVDVVAENGARWVRVNTLKNSRLMMEFREIDSYLTSDEDEDKPGPRPAQPGFDNSVLRMGRDLLAAAKANSLSTLVPFSTLHPDSNSIRSHPDSILVTPQVTIRLTRLDPLEDDLLDPRIEKTIQCLRHMGIDVQLGERPFPPTLIRSIPTNRKPLQPTTNVNLDLSALIALISDISHSPLPRTEADADARFVPPQSYLDWKKSRSKRPAHQSQTTSPLLYNTKDGEDNEDKWENSRQYSRALAAQVAQEMSKGILEEIHERLSSALGHLPITSLTVAFWTTSEARHRCLQIVSRIGGEKERQRADALLGSTLCSRIPPVPTPALYPNGLQRTSGTVETASGMHGVEETAPSDAFWEHSRRPTGFLPLAPVQIYPSTLSAKENEDRQSSTGFFDSLARTCAGILLHEIDPMSQVYLLASTQEILEDTLPSVQTSLPKLTAHTARSMLAGTSRRHTTLTTNRSSVKAVLKEMQRVLGKGGCGAEMEDVPKAALWILDPRSLSEGMRSQ